MIAELSGWTKRNIRDKVLPNYGLLELFVKIGVPYLGSYLCYAALTNDSRLAEIALNTRRLLPKDTSHLMMGPVIPPE